MSEKGIVLEYEEEAVLEIFKVRLVGKGVGLTHDVLASELKWVPGEDLDRALSSLAEKGLLSNPVYYQKIHILTAAGKQYIEDHLSPV
jgi:hypothetical protein